MDNEEMMAEMARRRKNLAQLQRAGLNPWGQRFDRTLTIAEAHKLLGTTPSEADEPVNCIREKGQDRHL